MVIPVRGASLVESILPTCIGQKAQLLPVFWIIFLTILAYAYPPIRVNCFLFLTKACFSVFFGMTFDALSNFYILNSTNDSLSHLTNDSSSHYALFAKHALTNDVSAIYLKLAVLLDEFDDVFPEELPPGLPPVRRIQHAVDLVSDGPFTSTDLTICVGPGTTICVGHWFDNTSLDINLIDMICVGLRHDANLVLFESYVLHSPTQVALLSPSPTTPSASHGSLCATQIIHFILKKVNLGRTLNTIRHR